MSKFGEGIVIIAALIGILAGGLYVIKNKPQIGCVNYFIGEACGVNVPK